MRDLDDLFGALAKSAFRSGFRLGQKEQAYLNRKGLAVVLDEARHFIITRLGPAWPARDGSQTPMKNHPAFIAQHATATCCRKCLAKWHGIAQGQKLNEEQVQHVLSVLGRWLEELARK